MANRSLRFLRYILPLAALVAIAVYVASQLWNVGLQSVGFIAYLALGPLGMFGVTEIGRLLDRNRASVSARSGIGFGTVAFAIWTVVVLVQTGTRQIWRNRILPDLTASLGGNSNAARAIFRGMDTIQVTMDVAFDVFYCLAILCLATGMYRHPAFGRLVAILGLASASGLLAFNLWTFPLPPSDAGLWDLGPLTGIWWMLVIILAFRAQQRAGLPDPVAPS